MSPDSERSITGKSLVVLGCGDLGLRLAAALPQWQVTGLCRSPQRLPDALRGPAVDYTRPGSLDFLAGLAPDYIVTTLKPVGKGEPGYIAGFTEATRNLLRGLGNHRPRALLMVSSTRVYAEQHGGWVDEHSPLTTQDPCAQAIIQAEQLLLGAGCNAATVRCAGIYGDPQGRLLTRIASGELCAPQPTRYSNRIHRDDVAGFLAHLLLQAAGNKQLAPVYLACDDQPAPQAEVEQWLAGQLGVPRESAQLVKAPPQAHKRCRNRALRDSGFQLRYPGYRSGYAAVLAQRASGEGGD
ncbi:NAD(P)H-binding protein [Parahaliea aestuarii]|uniref:NAD(P)H-binding protein n=1 Tax=Parahaliea aestuarii TaxID=1852021 RepID=A0A5C8ZV66_9GAMM|nr:NAD(P)H-binding protein [Parahaliea aestuarii]TXS92413.1 NAD(P)H-binding protein [Parahaliea aestuarii]